MPIFYAEVFEHMRALLMIRWLIRYFYAMPSLFAAATPMSLAADDAII